MAGLTRGDGESLVDLDRGDGDSFSGLLVLGFLVWASTCMSDGAVLYSLASQAKEHACQTKRQTRTFYLLCLWFFVERGSGKYSCGFRLACHHHWKCSVTCDSLNSIFGEARDHPRCFLGQLAKDNLGGTPCTRLLSIKTKS